MGGHALARHTRLSHLVLLGAIVLGLAAPAWAAQFPIARIYIEYNSTDQDLGFHVFLDAEDWETVTIGNPAGATIFEVQGKGAFGDLGLTELFFEGAEPNLDEFPLQDLLNRFPEGRYRFLAETVDGKVLSSMAPLSHAVPAGPVVAADVGPSSIVIRWQPVTGPAAILPNGKVVVVGYQVIVESFQVTVPASTTQVTLPAELAASLSRGEHPFEVLAIEASGNQTITEGRFVKP